MKNFFVLFVARDLTVTILYKVYGNCNFKFYEKIFFLSENLWYSYDNNQFQNLISGVESRNSEREFNYALVFADKMIFQGPYVFLVKEGHRFFNIPSQDQRPCKVDEYYTQKSKL